MMQEEAEQEKGELSKIEQEAFLKQVSFNGKGIVAIESLKYRTKKRAVDTPHYRDVLPASSKDHENTQVRGDRSASSGTLDHRQEVRPGDHKQGIREKMTTLALIRTLLKRLKGGLINSTALAMRMDKSLAMAKVRNDLHVLEGKI